MAKTIVGSFDTFEEARDVLQELQQRGFSGDDVSVLGNEASARLASRSDLNEADAPLVWRDPASGAGSWAAAGGAFGAATGLAVSAMGLAIPGVGPIIAAGPLVATLAGAGVGAIAGGFIGWLTTAGVPEEHAHYYAESVRRGGTLVLVRTDDARAEQAAVVMRSHGAVDIERRAEQWRAGGWVRHEPGGAPYSAEEIERERATYRDTRGRPLQATAGAAGVAAGSSAARVPAGDEWTEQRSYFRSRHAEAHGATTRFEEYEPAYHYGWDMGRNERYRGRDWSAVEPALRADWERRYPEGGNWERFKSAIRSGWERTTDTVESAAGRRR